MNTPHFEYLEKYLGTPEIRPLWENKPEKLLGVLNVEVGVVAQAGPLLDEDIAAIAEALKNFFVFDPKFDETLIKVQQNIIDRNPECQLHKAWYDAYHKSEDEYEAWRQTLTTEERAKVDKWTEDMDRYLFEWVFRRHREEQLASYGPDRMSPLDKIFHSID